MNQDGNTSQNSSQPYKKHARLIILDQDCLRHKDFLTFKLIKDEFPHLYSSISGLTTKRYIQQGEILFTEGGFDNRIYFVLKGRVGLYKKKPLSKEEKYNLIDNYKEIMLKQNKKTKKSTKAKSSFSSNRTIQVTQTKNNSGDSVDKTGISKQQSTIGPLQCPNLIKGPSLIISQSTKNDYEVQSTNAEKVTNNNKNTILGNQLNKQTFDKIKNLTRRKAIVVGKDFKDAKGIGLDRQELGKVILKNYADKILKVIVREAIRRRMRIPYVTDDWKVKEQMMFYAWANLLSLMTFKSRWQRGKENLQFMKLLKPGDSYGEFMLLRVAPCYRACTGVAEEYTELLEIDIREFFKVLNQHRAVICGKSCDFLQEFSLFQKISKETLFINSQYFDESEHQFNRYVFREGCQSSNIYVVLEGKFAEYKKIAQKDICKINNVNKSLQSKFLKAKNVYKDISVRIVEGGLIGVKDCLLTGRHTRSLKCVSQRGKLLKMSVSQIKTNQFIGWKDEDFEKVAEPYEQEFQHEFEKRIKFYEKYQNEVIGLSPMVNSHANSYDIKKFITSNPKLDQNLLVENEYFMNIQKMKEKSESQIKYRFNSESSKSVFVVKGAASLLGSKKQASQSQFDKSSPVDCITPFKDIGHSRKMSHQVGMMSANTNEENTTGLETPDLKSVIQKTPDFENEIIKQKQGIIGNCSEKIIENHKSPEIFQKKRKLSNLSVSNPGSHISMRRASQSSAFFTIDKKSYFQKNSSMANENSNFLNNMESQELPSNKLGEVEAIPNDIEKIRNEDMRNIGSALLDKNRKLKQKLKSIIPDFGTDYSVIQLPSLQKTISNLPFMVETPPKKFQDNSNYESKISTNVSKEINEPIIVEKPLTREKEGMLKSIVNNDIYHYRESYVSSKSIGKGSLPNNIITVDESSTIANINKKISVFTNLTLATVQNDDSGKFDNFAENMNKTGIMYKKASKSRKTSNMSRCFNTIDNAEPVQVSQLTQMQKESKSFKSPQNSSKLPEFSFPKPIPDMTNLQNMSTHLTKTKKSSEINSWDIEKMLKTKKHYISKKQTKTNPNENPADEKDEILEDQFLRKGGSIQKALVDVVYGRKSKEIGFDKNKKHHESSYTHNFFGDAKDNPRHNRSFLQSQTIHYPKLPDYASSKIICSADKQKQINQKLNKSELIKLDDDKIFQKKWQHYQQRKINLGTIDSNNKSNKQMSIKPLNKEVDIFVDYNYIYNKQEIKDHCSQPDENLTVEDLNKPGSIGNNAVESKKNLWNPKLNENSNMPIIFEDNNQKTDDNTYFRVLDFYKTDESLNNNRNNDRHDCTRGDTTINNESILVFKHNHSSNKDESNKNSDSGTNKEVSVIKSKESVYKDSSMNSDKQLRNSVFSKEQILETQKFEKVDMVLEKSLFDNQDRNAPVEKYEGQAEEYIPRTQVFNNTLSFQEAEDIVKHHKSGQKLSFFEIGDNELELQPLAGEGMIEVKRKPHDNHSPDMYELDLKKSEQDLIQNLPQIDGNFFV